MLIARLEKFNHLQKVKKQRIDQSEEEKTKEKQIYIKMSMIKTLISMSQTPPFSMPNFVCQ